MPFEKTDGSLRVCDERDYAEVLIWTIDSDPSACLGKALARFYVYVLRGVWIIAIESETHDEKCREIPSRASFPFRFAAFRRVRRRNR